MNTTHPDTTPTPPESTPDGQNHTTPADRVRAFLDAWEARHADRSAVDTLYLPDGVDLALTIADLRAVTAGGAQ